MTETVKNARRLMAATSSNLGAAGKALAISIPRTEGAVIRHFQERMCRTFREEPLGTPVSLRSGALVT